MVRLYHKELKKLKNKQNLALITVLDNGERIVQYFQFIKNLTRVEKGKILFFFKDLVSGEVFDGGFNIINFGKRYQHPWPIVYMNYKNSNKDSYVVCKFFAKLSQKDEANMLISILSET